MTYGASIVAPYKASVDLNVIPRDIDQAQGASGVADTSRPPPSASDLGGCLWGPTVAADERAIPTGGGSGKGSLYGPGALGDQPLRQAWVEPPAAMPREVVFAYIAQPGGMLWRVGLVDGEVESTHRPTPVQAPSDKARAIAESVLEIGLMRAVLIGKTQVLRAGISTLRSGASTLLCFAFYVPTCPHPPFTPSLTLHLW